MREVTVESAIEQECRQPQAIRICVDRITAFSLIGHLQLALRHPRGVGASATLCIDFIERLAEQLPPAMRESVAMGFDPAFDQSKEVNRG